MDEITRVPNGGLQCRFLSTIQDVPADPIRFKPGDTCFCEEGWVLFKVSLDGIWKEME